MRLTPPLLLCFCLACGYGENTAPTPIGTQGALPRVKPIAPVPEPETRQHEPDLQHPRSLAQPEAEPVEDIGAQTPLPVAWPRAAFDYVGADFRRTVIAETHITGLVGRAGAGIVASGAEGGLFRTDHFGRWHPLPALKAVNSLHALPEGLVACGDGRAQRADAGEGWAELGFECAPGAGSRLAYLGARSFALTPEGLRVGALVNGAASIHPLALYEPQAIAAMESTVVIFDADAVLRSVDGGQHFEKVERPIELRRARSVAFLSKRVLIAVGEGSADAPGIVYSRDGGATWSLPALAPRGTEDLAGLAIDGRGRALATPVDGGRAFVSEDGGHTWRPLELQTPLAGPAIPLPGGFLAAAPRGLARPVEARGPRPLGLDQPLWRAVFTHPRVGVGVGVDGGLYRREGSAWFAVPRTAGIRFWDLAVVEGHTVVAVGEGLLWRSEDAGRSWSHLPPPSSCAARWVAFAGARGLIGCAEGALYRSEDGGEAWTLAAHEAPSGRAVFFEGGVAALRLDGEGVLVSEAGERWSSYEVPDGVVHLSPAPEGLGLVDERGALYRSAEGHNWYALLEPAGATGRIHAHRAMPDGRVLLLGEHHLWLRGAGAPRALARSAGAHALSPRGDGALLLLGARATARLSPR